MWISGLTKLHPGQFPRWALRTSSFLDISSLFLWWTRLWWSAYTLWYEPLCILSITEMLHSRWDLFWRTFIVPFNTSSKNSTTLRCPPYRPILSACEEKASPIRARQPPVCPLQLNYCVVNNPVTAHTLTHIKTTPLCIHSRIQSVGYTRLPNHIFT